jgi:hypothetical protein
MKAALGFLAGFDVLAMPSFALMRRGMQTFFAAENSGGRLASSIANDKFSITNFQLRPPRSIKEEPEIDN